MYSARQYLVLSTYWVSMYKKVGNDLVDSYLLGSYK